MIVDGRAIATKHIERINRQIQKSLTKRKAPVLVVVQVGEDTITNQFIGIKSKVAQRAGVTVRHERLPDNATTEEIKALVVNCAGQADVSGIIVQLPLPDHVDQNSVLDAIPVKKDPDMLSSKSIKGFQDATSDIMPPVVSAIGVILSESGVNLDEKSKVLVIGQGKLVGKPVVTWLRQGGVEPKVATRATENIAELVRESKVIISGAGSPGLIKPEMLTEGSIVVDAGTSEQGGRVSGDAEPACAEKCSVFTPVPGGVGPVAVAMLFHNLITLWE